MPESDSRATSADDSEITITPKPSDASAESGLSPLLEVKDTSTSDLLSVTMYNNREKIQYTKRDPKKIRRILLNGCPKTTDRPQRSYLCLSVFACIMNPPMGAVALAMLVMARASSRRSLVTEAKRRATIAKYLSFVSIAFSVVVISFAMVYKYVILQNVVNDIKELFWHNTLFWFHYMS